MKMIPIVVLLSLSINWVLAQAEKVQQGLLFKAGTSLRLANVSILNKRSRVKTFSNTVGVFNMPALPGDTLSFTSNGFQSPDFVVTDFTDKIVFMQPVIYLDEVVVKERSLNSEIKEVQRGYREKSVFYTGTPHYYYLVLKPMTFIYENFKSEVKEARRFNRYARKELASVKVTERFNDKTIKKVAPLNNEELKDFKMTYMPTLQQINVWNDYDLINYVKQCYADYQKKIKNI
jgi:hypothetical protein